MKSIKLSLALLLATGMLFVSCKKEADKTSENGQEPALTSPAIAKAESATFNIDGMTCAMGCAKVIENKLTGLDGVEKATIDFDKKTATIQYNAALQTPEKFVEVVEAVADGKTYKVSNLKSSADKAMLFQDTPKQEKRKAKKAKKATAEYTTTAAVTSANSAATPVVVPVAEKKAGCCASKKACSEKPATL